MDVIDEEYTDCMVDIETTGTSPDRTGILQISAVKFNIKTRKVDPNFFDRCLTVPPHRFWEQSTAEWWATQNRSTLEGILKRQEDPTRVIHDFLKWVTQSKKLNFWAKPTTFDFMFLSSYFKDMGLPFPFHYREAKDLNSFLHGLHWPNQPPAIEYRDLGAVHNALNDTLSQISFLFDHLEARDANR